MPRDRALTEVVALEHRLLAPEVRGDPAAVRALLHPEFREIGASGRTWDRDAVAAALAAEPGGSVTTTDVEAVWVAGGVALVTYTAQCGATRSRRSSLWLRDNGTWLLRFHQGTPA